MDFVSYDGEGPLDLVDDVRTFPTGRLKIFGRYHIKSIFKGDKALALLKNGRNVESLKLNLIRNEGVNSISFRPESEYYVGDGEKFSLVPFYLGYCPGATILDSVREDESDGFVLSVDEVVEFFDQGREFSEAVIYRGVREDVVEYLYREQKQKLRRFESAVDHLNYFLLEETPQKRTREMVLRASKKYTTPAKVNTLGAYWPTNTTKSR